MDSQYYIEKLFRSSFRSSLEAKTSLRGMKLLYDNARCHGSALTSNSIESSGMTVIDHPQYSPDIAPCDYWLFNYIKERLDDETLIESLTKSITKILKNTPHQEYLKTFNKYCILRDLHANFV